MPFVFCEEDLKNEHILSQKLTDLSCIVFTRHYFASKVEREDLISIGVVKALSLIQGGSWTQSRGKMLNYLYTGIRNEMHNYLYKMSREVCSEYTVGVNITCSINSFSNDNDYFIDQSIIEEVCSDFLCYGNLADIVSEKLSDMGFIIRDWKRKNKCDLTKVLGEVVNTYSIEFSVDLIDRLCGAVIWKLKDPRESFQY